jgi:hypothetical protein
MISLGDLRWQETLTPRTIPVGKMMPKDNIISKMCTHSIESCRCQHLPPLQATPNTPTIGSALIDSPVCIFSILCPPCAAAPFAESTTPMNNANDGVRNLRLSMLGILAPVGVSARLFRNGADPGRVESRTTNRRRRRDWKLSRSDESRR